MVSTDAINVRVLAESWHGHSQYREAGHFRGPRDLGKPPSGGMPAAAECAMRVVEALVKRRLQPLGVFAIIRLAVEFTARDVGQNSAGTGQRLAVDALLRVPQVGAHQRLLALEIHRLD